MPVANLTKRTVDAIKPGEKSFVVYDASLKGFGVKVSPNGHMSWVVEYRPNGGGRSVAKKRLKIGVVGKDTPEEARKAAKRVLGEVANHGDPAADRAHRRKQLKVRDLVDRWEKDNPLGKRGKTMAPRTRVYTLGRLRHHVIPLIGSMAIDEVSTSDIERMIAAITSGKTATSSKGKPRGRIRVKGGAGAARKVAADVSMLFSYAICEKLTSVNPVIEARKPKAGKRTDYLRTSELGALGKALDEMEAEGVNKRGLDILRLIVLTGCRPAEVEGLMWSEVDLQQCSLMFENSKTDASSRPISTEAMAIIAVQMPIDGSPYVFPATRGDGHFQGSKKFWTKARERANLTTRVRYHARHGMATLSLGAGNSVATVASLMGHSNPRTTLQTYSHVIDGAASKAAESMGKTLSSALSGKPPAPVVMITRSKAK